MIQITFAIRLAEARVPALKSVGTGVIAGIWT